MKAVRLLLTLGVAVSSAAGLLRAQQADSTALSIIPSVSSQRVPRLIKLSGTLNAPTAKPPGGPVDVHFSIYMEQNDLTPLWQETQTLNVDEQGHYSALLGATQPEGLPTELFTSGEAHWLGVAAGDLPEQPRTLLVSVPYALKANDSEMLGGKPASAYLLAEPAGGLIPAWPVAGGGIATDGRGAPPELVPARGPKGCQAAVVFGGGTSSFVPLWDSSCRLGDSVLFQNDGKIGVGTTTPDAGLTVAAAGIHRGVGNINAVFSSASKIGPQLWFGTGGGSSTFDGREWSLLASASGNPIARGAGKFLIIDRTAGSPRLTIDSSGKIGIGTTTPDAGLTVAAVGIHRGIGNINAVLSSATDNGPQLWFGTGGGSSTYDGREWSLLASASRNPISGGAGKFLIVDRTAGLPRLTIDTSGNVGIGTTTPDNALSVNGSADKPGGGSWGTFSDARLKTVGSTFRVGLPEVLKLNPIYYRYKERNALGIADHDEHVGLVAQEVKSVIPEAVSENSKGYLLVNNDPIMWAMLNAIKQQQAQIQTLTAHVQQLQATERNLTRQVKDLEKVQRQMATLRARLARLEGQAAESHVGSANRAAPAKHPRGMTLAKAQF